MSVVIVVVSVVVPVVIVVVSVVVTVVTAVVKEHVLHKTGQMLATKANEQSVHVAEAHDAAFVTPTVVEMTVVVSVVVGARVVGH